MKKEGCQKFHFKRIALFAFFIFLFTGSLTSLFSNQSWYLAYLHSFVFTAACTSCCTVLICKSIATIHQYHKMMYYSLFTLLVVIGICTGVLIGTLILEQKLAINKEVLLFSLLIGFVSSVVITGYLLFKENLENKISQIKEIEIENERLKRFELEARLSSLQAKLNPHFLFNTLNSTAALIYDNPSQAEESIVRLSDLYRKILSTSNQNYISLREEIEIIEDMLELERLRFEENLSYNISCPESLCNTRIPGLLVEPLVENVIKHVQNQKVHIDIQIEWKNNKLAIRVEDNGPGFDVQKADFGFGLYSVQERLRMLFGEQAELNIDSAPGKGTKVTIRIPILESYEK